MNRVAEKGEAVGPFDRVLNGMAVLAAATLVAVTLSIVYEVVSRYAFGKPTTWAIDFSEYALLVCLFFASAWVLANDAHIKIDIFVSLLPAKAVLMFTLGGSLIGVFSCAVFFIVATIAVWEAYRDGDVIWHSVIVSKWIVWSPMPIGALLLTLQFARRAWANVKAL